jgi:hypothetical protein
MEDHLKPFYLIALLLTALVLTALPISPQYSVRNGLELKLDSAEAITYRRARVTSRRVARRDYRYTRRAVRRGAVVYGAGYRRGCTCY